MAGASFEGPIWTALGVEETLNAKKTIEKQKDKVNTEAPLIGGTDEPPGWSGPISK